MVRLNDSTLNELVSSHLVRKPSHKAETRELLDAIADQRQWMCRWQRHLTVLHNAAVVGEMVPEAEVSIVRSGMRDACARLARLREELKRHDPHAWRVHEYGLALATEAARGVQLARRLGSEEGRLDD